jgi:hypothetical protein
MFILLVDSCADMQDLRKRMDADEEQKKKQRKKKRKKKKEKKIRMIIT